jgi:hypothetical protein
MTFPAAAGLHFLPVVLRYEFKLQRRLADGPRHDREDLAVAGPRIPATSSETSSVA